jgi:hypothetical protein
VIFRENAVHLIYQKEDPPQNRMDDETHGILSFTKELPIAPEALMANGGRPCRRISGKE